MKNLTRGKSGFTLLELILAMIVFSIIFTVLFSLFIRMIRTKSEIEARGLLVQNTYDIMERFNTILQDYTVDYEEYFNRAMVGCADPGHIAENTASMGLADFDRQTDVDHGYCTVRSAYGNQSALMPGGSYIANQSQHRSYACSTSTNDTLLVPGVGSQPVPTDNKVVSPQDNGAGCYMKYLQEYGSAVSVLTDHFYQPYGAYTTQFIDVKDDVDDKLGRIGDDDDTYIGRGPKGIYDGNNIKELYLISKDKKTRVFLRRALMATGDFNNDGATNDVNYEKQYTLQMLQLKAFDAGINHDFDAGTYEGVYDGVIDTWACDTEAGFICNGASIGSGIYSGYYLPADGNDGWVSLFSNDVNVRDWNITIYPIKDPALAFAESDAQINPYVRMNIETSIYGKNWYGKLGSSINNVTYDLQTSFNIKSNY